MVLGDGLLFLFSVQEGFFWRVETPGQIHQVKWPHNKDHLLHPSGQESPNWRAFESVNPWCKKNKTCLGLSYLWFWYSIAAKKGMARRLHTWKSCIKGWYVKLPVVHLKIVRQIVNMSLRGDSLSDDHQFRRLISWYSKYHSMLNHSWHLTINSSNKFSDKIKFWDCSCSITRGDMTFEDQLSSRRLPAKIPVADTSVEEKLFVSEPTSHKNDFYSLFWVAKKKFCREYEVPNFEPANQGVVVPNKRCKGWLAGRIMPAAVYEARSSGPPGIAGDQPKHTDPILSFSCSLIDRDSNKGAYNPYSEGYKKNHACIKHQTSTN